MLRSTIPDDIFRNIRRIQISTSRLVTELFAGEYKSVFKGKGLEFSEVREYQIGDDIRAIDWNVTARQGKPFVKRYIEERELTVMLLLDVSASTYFGTVKAFKRDMAAEAASILAASASSNNDKVGLIIFSDVVEKFIPPRKGIRHVMRIIREILYCEPRGKGTDIPMALQYLDKVSSRSTISFLVSDFYSDDIKKPLLIANKRHDIIAVTVTDPRDRELPDVGLLAIKDAETGRERVIDTSSGSVRSEYARLADEGIRSRKRMFGSVKIDNIEISPEITYSDALRKFFEVRKIRRGVSM